MKPVRMLGAAILALTGLVAVGLTTEAANAASSKDLVVQYSKVMKYETVAAGGTLATHVSRPVKLQYRDHDYGAWTTKATTTSSAAGTFSFSVSTSRSRYYRYYAPATDVAPKIVGYSRKLTVVAQKVEYFGLSVRGTCSVFANEVTMWADFYPSRLGRQVAFTTNKGVKYATEDIHGVASVTFDPGLYSVFSFDAVATATAYNGAAAKSSSPVNYEQHPC